MEKDKCFQIINTSLRLGTTDFRTNNLESLEFFHQYFPNETKDIIHPIIPYNHGSSFIVNFISPQSVDVIVNTYRANPDGFDVIDQNKKTHSAIIKRSFTKVIEYIKDENILSTEDATNYYRLILTDVSQHLTLKDIYEIFNCKELIEAITKISAKNNTFFKLLFETTQASTNALEKTKNHNEFTVNYFVLRNKKNKFQKDGHNLPRMTLSDFL